MKTTFGTAPYAAIAVALAAGCAAESSTHLGEAEQAATQVTSGSVIATLETTSSWSGGFCQSVTLKNSGAAVTNWTLKLASNGATITSIWSASQATSGTTVTVSPSSYNAGIAANGSVNFGYCGTGSAQPTLTSIVVSGGSSGTGGATASGGTTAKGGSSSVGGTTAKGGSSSAGGTTAKGGSSSVGGGTAKGPCDIYGAANTPCVAAHSTVRALFGAYSGNLYQVRRASDNTTKDIAVLAPGGFANSATQETFCAGTTCTISAIYDQSSYKNHLTKSGKMYWLANGAKEADASKAKIKVGGHTVYGVYAGGGIGYRNAATTGVAKGDEAESMYMVVDGKRFNDQCCFDYGNAETTGNDDGNGTMETVYFGSDITWGGKGEGSGPWVAADLENGVYKSDKGGWQSQSVYTASAKSIIANYATVLMKGPSGSKFGLKAGDAQSGPLTTMWNGNRPSNGYSPKKLQGAIILGTGGDGSPTGIGTFFEGVMTKGNPPDSADDAVQANIVAAGYGK